MTHVYRFHTPEDTPARGVVSLSPEEAHHALRVVRCQVGDPVVLFDGAGREWSGRIASASKREIDVSVESVREIPRPATRLVLVQAFLNHQKSLEALIRRCTELGVDRFVFFKGAHSERAGAHPEKWHRFAIESCKQCGRAWLPEFTSASDLATALGGLGSCVSVVATPVREPVPVATALAGAREVAVVVGPEGGLSEGEVDAALELGAVPVSLGELVLRSEAAAAAACAVLQYELGALGPRA